MKLFQAVKLCGEIAALDLSETYFSAEKTPPDKDVQLFVTAAGFVVDELFATSGYMLCRTEAEAKNGFIALDDMIKAISVTDESGNAVTFRYTDGGLLTTDCDKAAVIYAKRPTHPGWQDEVPVPTGIASDRVVIYGMLAEYFLMRGDVNQSVVWRTRFVDAATIDGDKKFARNLPQRRWL